MAVSDKAGVYVVGNESGSQFFVTGHSEYDVDTLATEYYRDLNAGKNPNIPENYFEDDNPENGPVLKWRSHGQLLYTNWLNYFVYQTTPFDIKKVNE